MSVIAIDNIPPKFGLNQVAKIFATTINGKFEVLNFLPSKNRMAPKKCYIKLSEKLDPWFVIERINHKQIGHHSCYATIPDVVPDLPLSKKPKTLPKKLLKKMNLTPQLSERKMIYLVHRELTKEIMSKYTGLMKLNENTGGKLLHDISATIKERLNQIMQEKKLEQCYKLSQSYRFQFPHAGDLKLIENAANKFGVINGPLTNIIMKQPPIDENRVCDLPLERVQKLCEEFEDRIIKRLVAYIDGLQTTPDPNKSPEGEAAKIRVRRAFHKLKPYIPEMIRLLVKKNVIPDKDANTVFRIYGEPFLPAKVMMIPLLKKYCGISKRSDILHNFLTVKVPSQYAQDMYNLDSTVINRNTILVRPLIIPGPRFVVTEETEEQEEEEMKDEEEIKQEDDDGEEYTESWEGI